MAYRGYSLIVYSAIMAVIIMSGAAMGMGNTPGIPDISIENEMAVLSPIMTRTASVFMVINNTGNSSDSLIGARISDPGATVELHNVKDNRMFKTDKIRIPSGSKVELKPKSLHIMIFNLPQDMKEGSKLTLFLRFEKSGEREVQMKLIKGGITGHHHMP